MATELPRSERRGRVRGALLCVAGLAAAFVLMARPGHLPHGALWGGLCLVLAALGLLRAFGTLVPLTEEARTSLVPLSATAWGRLPDEPRFAAPVWGLLAGVVTLLLTCALWTSGISVAVVLACLCMLPAAMRRPGLLLFIVVGLLYLPGLGSYGLWDPWETHYGEVAREILARDDWISLWWAQDGWFWSKPILIFWAEALVWSASGLDFTPDSQFKVAEWVLRLPVCVLSMLAVQSVYLLIRHLWNVRAGFLAGLVLATAPFFALLSHQAITDMYFVANMTIAMACLTAALTVDGERLAPAFRAGGYALSLQHLAIGLVFLLGVPQVLYLASRNVTLVDGFIFALHGDVFVSGSAGNAALVPGNAAMVRHLPVFSGLLSQPLALAIYFGLPLAYLLWSLHRERRLRALFMVAFYAFCALAFMGKGIPGFALPGLVAALWLLTEGRWSMLLSGQLLVTRGTLIVATLGLPWFVAEFMRQGTRFTDRLLIHDHINRLTLGVHGDNGSVQYFIAQLGYGLFPWICLAPLAGMLLVRRRQGHADNGAQKTALRVFGLWFIAAFTLFSAMTTKFHHYILPAVPPAAALVGLGLSMLWEAPGAYVATSRRWLWAGRLSTALAPVPGVCAVAGALGNLRPQIPHGSLGGLSLIWIEQQRWPLWAVGLGIGLSLALLFAGQRMRTMALADSTAVASTSATRDSGGVGAALLSGAAVAAFVARDLSWTTGQRPAGQERLIQLFIYKYDRPFPESLEYHALFGGFGCVLVALCIVAAAQRYRQVALQALIAGCVLYTAFTLFVYIPQLAPHWSQRSLVDQYYAERASADEALVAWQMNWKGENFYTGNRVAVFQELDNKRIKTYIDKHRGSRAFFVLEHKRLKRFRELLAPREVRVRSAEYDNNKFVLVSAKL